MGRQEQEEGYAEVEGERTDRQLQRESKESETRETDTWSQRQGLRERWGPGVTGNHNKEYRVMKQAETGTERQRPKQRHRDTAPERYNLRVPGRQRHRHSDSGKARRSERGRATQSQAGAAVGTAGVQVRAARFPPPYLGHAIPHDPGGGGPGAPPARRPESARVTATLMARARGLQPGGDEGAWRPQPRPALPSRRHCPPTAGQEGK